MRISDWSSDVCSSDLEVRKVPGTGWHGALAQAELVEALAAAGQRQEAIVLARTLAAVPNAEPERHVRLGQLLMQEKDYRAAASLPHGSGQLFGRCSPLGAAVVRGQRAGTGRAMGRGARRDRKSTRLNSSH